MASIAPPPGWYADPAGRHQARYWNGDAWSAYVVDQGYQSTDPLDGNLDGSPLGIPPAGMMGRPPRQASTRHGIHWAWWVVPLVAALAGGFLLLLFSGVFRDRCGDAGPGADLSGCEFRRADFRSENLKRADLSSADLRGADLRAARLNAANLKRADLRRAKLNGAHLNSANLAGAFVQGANFGGAVFHGAILRGTHSLARSNLIGARGLGDGGLEAAFGVGPRRLPTYLAAHGVQLEPRTVIRRGLKGVCSGRSMPQAASQPNGTMGVSGGRDLGNQSYWPPRSWTPVHRRYAARVACLSYETNTVETCYYSITGFGPGSPVARLEKTISITVRDAGTGEPVASTTFSGGYPPDCPGSLSLGTYRIFGARVPPASITHWLSRWRT